MEKKTVGYLNEKIWYRLIKVFYVLFYFLIIFISIVIIFEQYSPNFDEKNSYVLCNDGRKIYPSRVGINLNYRSISYFDDAKVRKLCISNAELGEILRSSYPGVYDNLTNDQLGINARDKKMDFIEKIKITDKNYLFIDVDTKRDWISIVLYSLLSIVLITLVLDCIRRVFYYIVIGSFKPKK